MIIRSIKDELNSLAYHGRGIIIGKSADGKKAVTAYFIMGRSENSRNRVFVLEGDAMRTKAFDESNCNNWETSSLRKAMNAIDGKGRFKLKEFAGINTDDLVPIRRGLLTDDGMPDYGECEDKITIYTAEEYRRYRIANQRVRTSSTAPDATKIADGNLHQPWPDCRAE